MAIPRKLLETISNLKPDELQIVKNSIQGHNEQMSLTMLKLYIPEANLEDLLELRKGF